MPVIIFKGEHTFIGAVIIWKKFANGIADNLLLNILLATKVQIIVCPAMNVNMYENKIIQENITRLKKNGVIFIEPESGELACGWEGKGRLAEVENILKFIKKKTSK